MVKYLFLTDFDATLIVKNSHEYLDELCSDQKFLNKIQSKYEKNHLWFERMDQFYKKINQLNITSEQILKQYENILFLDGAEDLIRKLCNLGWFLAIISDGYEFVIKNVLEKSHLLNCFNQIECNPNIWMNNGRLKIQNYAKDKLKIEQFDCQYGCPTNMCKGQIIDKIRRENSNTRLIYCGDSKNDYCPCIHSEINDLIFVRKSFPLEKLLEENLELIKSKIFFFNTFNDIENDLIRMNIL